jgi:NAD(P)-dependent dehydrogenase (short-subunit alcohol dehydrogenase family)
MGTVVVTGSGSGIGAATAARLRTDGHTVIGVDLRGAEIEADLGTPAGRASAIAEITERSGGVLNGLVPCAGIAGMPDRPGSTLVSVNYFGTVELLEGLRPLLLAGAPSAAVAISSNSTTTQPGYSNELVEVLLSGDEDAARALADRDKGGSVNAYPASKNAVAKWVRRHAVTEEWGKAGITLNAIAPGMIATPMIDEGRTDPNIQAGLEMFEATIAVGRPGRPEEIAGLIAYLLGPEARFFVGSIIFCDGGTDALFRADDWPALWEPQG